MTIHAKKSLKLEIGLLNNIQLVYSGESKRMKNFFQYIKRTFVLYLIPILIYFKYFSTVSEDDFAIFALFTFAPFANFYNLILLYVLNSVLDPSETSPVGTTIFYQLIYYFFISIAVLLMTQFPNINILSIVFVFQVILASNWMAFILFSFFKSRS